MPERMLDILLVEDDEIDLQTVRRHLNDPGVRLHIVLDALSAIAFLNNRHTMPADRRRWLILMDLNLPGASGIELLNYLRTTAHLAMIPVVVMTTSADQRDVQKAYAQHVNGYFIKPLEPMSFRRRLRAITTYWAESEMTV